MVFKGGGGAQNITLWTASTVVQKLCQNAESSVPKVLKIQFFPGEHTPGSRTPFFVLFKYTQAFPQTTMQLPFIKQSRHGSSHLGAGVGICSL